LQPAFVFLFILGAWLLAMSVVGAAPNRALAQSVQTQSEDRLLPVQGGAFQLVLRPNGYARLIETAPPDSEMVRSWSGLWTQGGDLITIRLTMDENGVALTQTILLEGIIQNGEFSMTSVGLNQLSYDREDLELTLGAGQRHPLVREVNGLLSQIPYLNYASPADDRLYSENVRRSVSRFQAAEGLMPTGLIDLRTLLALATPTRARLDLSRVQFTVAGDAINARSGPSTNYPVLYRVYRGDTLEVIGRIGVGAPRNIWLQVCCLDGGVAWIRSDLGAISGELGLVRIVPSEELPPEPTAATAAQPLLANLPATTPDGAPIVYLTFDDGPNGDYTQRTLELLRQYNARATFFVVGRQVRDGVDLVRSAAADGHYIANHTWDHVYLDQISREEFYDQVQRTRNELVNAAGDLFTLDGDVFYVRPPYGAISAENRQWLAEMGLTSVLWDIDPQDWRRPGVDAIAGHVLNHVFPGAIVLLHDGGGERSQTVAALEIILSELSARGYRFLNILGQ
jgi:peptidoglycan/xylan/chitin deacetylase (PgdA/CDA1 family)